MRKLGCLALFFCQSALAATVGKVTLLIGQATQISAQGQRQNILPHQNIFVGDTLETQAGAHLHIQFIDGAFLSLKPRSRLTIEDYQAASGGQKAAIKFKLEEGMARSITGAWGEAARERFRLNTPIAAIGVRGTDFTVAVHQQSLHTAVHQGAISVSPLDAQCSAQSFGSCQTAKTQFLSAEMGQMMLAYDAHSQKIALLPLDPKLAPERKKNSKTPPKRLQDSANDNEAAAVLSAKNAAMIGDPAPSLLWGRLQHEDEAASIFPPAAQISASYTPVLSTYNAQLFRKKDQASLPQILENRDLQFTLGTSEASFTNKHGTVPAQITSGNFAFNFANLRFKTALDMQSGKLTHQMRAEGKLADGFLLDQSGNVFLRGALGNAGKEAAYFFYTVHPEGGVFRGLTHWQQPAAPTPNHTPKQTNLPETNLFSGGQNLPDISRGLP